VAGVKQLPFIIAVVVVAYVFVWKKTEPKSEPPKAVPEKLIADPMIEKAIRKELNKPTGKLTEADLAKVTRLELDATQICDDRTQQAANYEN
jgi:hypothetical protein